MLLGKPEILYRFIGAGAEMQLTGDSLLGDFGRDVKKMACQLLQLNVRCYLGSDGHNAKKRKPVLTKAVKVAAREIGGESAAELVSLRLEKKRQKLMKIVSSWNSFM
jgi:protein-tyrosine phosphatase